MRKLEFVLVILLLTILPLLFSLSGPSPCSADVSSDGWGTMDSGTTEHLNDVWGTGSGYVFAVGDEGILLRYDGVNWGSLISGTEENLNGIWGTSATDFFVVGDSGTIRYFGSGGSVGMSSGTTEDLHAVWGADSDDVFAVGINGTILHYNGAGWSAMTSGTSENLSDVCGVSTEDVFAVGDGGTILRYDGENWKASNSYTEEDLYGIWGTSTINLFAVGNNGSVLSHDEAWGAISSGINNVYYDIDGSAASSFFIVGGVRAFGNVFIRDLWRGNSCPAFFIKAVLVGPIIGCWLYSAARMRRSPAYFSRQHLTFSLVPGQAFLPMKGTRSRSTAGAKGKQDQYNHVVFHCLISHKDFFVDDTLSRS